MAETAKYTHRMDLLQGARHMLLLHALREPIAQVIRRRSAEILTAATGSLYPALPRLERQKWIKSAWKLTESKQQAKQLTALGSNQLTVDYQRWLELVRAIVAGMAPEAQP